MSSLYSLFRKGKVLPLTPDDPSQAPSILKRLEINLRMFRPPDCIFVDVESVHRDLAVEYGSMYKETSFAEMVAGVPACTPPFEVMWLELHGWFAMAVSRIRTTAGFKVTAQLFVPGDGVVVGPVALVNLDLNAQGDLVQQPIFNDMDAEKNGRQFYVDACLNLVTCVHALGRMNCRNAKLETIDGPKFIPHAPRKPLAACVWHKIVLTDIPKAQTTGRDPFGDDENLIRSHWVRGHYADYRKSGLFGRPKSRGVYWIPEHKRGNEDLGVVIPEYAFS